MKKIFLPMFAFLLIGFTFAHQPRLVFDQPIGQITNIKNPEVSQAFYGILSGQDDVYQIVSDTWFLLYVNLVVPKMYGSRTDFTVDYPGHPFLKSVDSLFYYANFVKLGGF